MQYPGSGHRQEGAALIIGLLLLLLMTIIGTTAINVTTTETKIMANAKDKQVSFMGAEAALLRAEEFVSNPDKPPSCTKPAGYLGEIQTIESWWHSFKWGEDSGSLSTTGLGAKDADYAIEPPYRGASPYLFESISINNDIRYNYYRLTSHAKGPGRSETYLQGVFLLRERMNSGC